MHGTLRFWLDRGVDGFRMDVVHLIGKDPALPDAPPEQAHTNRVPFNDYPGTHPLLRGIRAVLDSYPGDRVMVGEVNLRETARISTYYGHCASGEGDELNLAFNFLSLVAGWDARAWSSLIDTVARELQPGAWPTWVLSNHDVRRLRTRLGGSEQRARAMALLLLTLRGTPFLYAGEELGLGDADVPADLALDPGGRDGCRAPIPWTATPPYGWSGKTPPLPFPPDAGARSYERQSTDGSSMLALYKRLLAVRRGTPALRSGTLERLDCPPGVVGYARRDDDERMVLLNFTAADAAVPLGTAYEVEVASTDARVTGAYTGVVPAETALLLRPRP
jgi:alpha-glucosidase